MGKAVNSEKPGFSDNPVAWTWQTPAGGKVFATTMGHPEDFSVEAFQRLVSMAFIGCWQTGAEKMEREKLLSMFLYRGM
jgi:hypothetical protein